MIILEFDPNFAATSKDLFPSDICEDPWVAFHGTSSVNKAKIESVGFQWTHNLALKKDLKRVASIFERMKWCGSDGGSYAVLRPFSLEHDFGPSSKSPIFFLEDCFRTLHYASIDNAGGENIRSIRRSINDIETYLSSEKLRKEHQEFQQIEYQEMLFRSVPSEPPQPVNLEWLKHELARLTDLKELCQEAQFSHRYGVVYAVRFQTDNLPNLEYNSFMGIEANELVPPERIIAKTIIPRDWDSATRRAQMCCGFLKSLKHGLIPAIKSRVGKN